MREDIKIDGIPIQDYGTPNSRSCYPGEIQIGETIKSNIDYWRNKYLEENDKNSYSLAEYWKNRYEEQLKYGNKVTLTGEAIPNVIDMLKKDYISKDKIKEKIENLSISLNDIENSLGMTANKYDTIKELNIKIDVLKELLEE